MTAGPGLVCPLPCYHHPGDVLPWPPYLPGSAHPVWGDLPTLLAYLQAIGDRLFSLERELRELKSAGAEPERLEKLEKAVRELDVRIVFR